MYLENEQRKRTDRHFTKEDLWMTNKHMRRCLMSLAFGEMQIKSTMRQHYTSIRIPTTKMMIILNTSGNVGKLGLLYIVGENVKWYSNCGKQAVSYKTKHTFIV